MRGRGEGGTSSIPAEGRGGELFTSAMESKDQSALKKRRGLQFYG